MSEWIEHDGSGMPVPGDTLVYVKLEDGRTDEDWAAPVKATFWECSSSNWSCDGKPRIVAYRVVTPDET